MKDNSILPDDPKLTAYALGELTGDERAAVEAALRQNPALRVAVENIRATAAQLEAALSAEPIFRAVTPTVATPGIVVQLNGHATEFSRLRATASKSAADTNGRHVAEEVEHGYELPHSRRKLVRFPQFYYVVATAAAACFAVIVALRDRPDPGYKSVERTVRSEIKL
jgi:anti-sigma factor RsiW